MGGCEGSVVVFRTSQIKFSSGGRWPKFNRQPAHHHRPSQKKLTQTNSQGLPIGVFDSGIGGLTVLRELQRHLPNETFVYFGDTARVPYGNRAQTELETFSHEILSWMAQYPVKMVVMACNTSSALTLDRVRHHYPFPVLGIILPGARAAVQQGQRIGVIATPATVASECYPRAIQEINAQVQVWQMACPEFVPLIEQGCLQAPETSEIVKARLQPLIEQEIDTLVYGCTHYPHLEGLVRQIVPPTVRLIDPACFMTKAVAQELELLRLQGCGQSSPHPSSTKLRFYVSGCSKTFAQQSQRFLGHQPQVESIQLPTLVKPRVDSEVL
jgi:glutamate racemase